MIYELNHFGIMVADSDASVRFYEALDARVVFDHTTPGGVKIRYLQLAGGMIELVGIPATIAPPGLVHGIDHLAFMTDDLENDYQRLLDAGCTADGGTKDAASGHGRLGFVRRPDGARIELLQRDSEFRLADADGGVVVAFDHYAYAVADLEEATRFFSEVVGMNRLGELTTGDGAAIRSFLDFGYDVLGLRAEPEHAGVFPHFVLRVADVDEALALLATRGVTPAEPPSDSPSGQGRRAFLVDPDGVRVELLDRPDLHGAFPASS